MLSGCGLKSENVGFHIGMDKRAAYDNICQGRASNYVKWVAFFASAPPDGMQAPKANDYSPSAPACSQFRAFSKYDSWFVDLNENYDPHSVHDSTCYNGRYRIELAFKNNELRNLTMICGYWS
jgi:hypothetical protein